MKRIYTLLAVLGIAMTVLTGCDQGTKTSTTSTDTNAPAPPAAPASTNK